MVQVPKIVKLAVYRHLFKNNSLCIPETNRVQEIAEITYTDSDGNEIHPRNLYVNMVVKSLKSRGYVKDTFAWKHHYFLLTADGEKYIRQELDIEAMVRPGPCTKQIAEKPQEEQRQRDGFRRERPAGGAPRREREQRKQE